MWNKGFLKAIEVAQEIQKQLPEYVTYNQIYASGDSMITNEWYHIQAYQNGREQGVSIWIPNLKGEEFGCFYICENRHGGFGYYFGRYAMQGLSHDAYQNGFNSYKEKIVEDIVLRIKCAL